MSIGEYGKPQLRELELERIMAREVPAKREKRLVA
jgi:hypothetical protein